MALAENAYPLVIDNVKRMFEHRAKSLGFQVRHKHPRLREGPSKREGGMKSWQWLLVIYVLHVTHVVTWDLGYNSGRKAGRVGL